MRKRRPISASRSTPSVTTLRRLPPSSRSSPFSPRAAPTTSPARIHTPPPPPGAAFLAALLAPAAGHGGVKVSAPKGVDDAVKRAILSGPKFPADVYEVRQHLGKGGGTLTPHPLANRGHANPARGSFSFFMT